MRKIVLGIALSLLASVFAHAGETPSPANAKLYFIGLKDGDTVTSPVTIRFGLSGMGIAPAGTQVENTGHHHLIIDDKIEGAALDEAIPMDEKHLHFGKGQTEASVTLPKGQHTLQLVLGDWTHIPHKPPVMSERITVHVACGCVSPSPGEGGSTHMSEAKCKAGWGDLSSRALFNDEGPSPHPGPYLASLDRGPTLPLQGRVRKITPTRPCGTRGRGSRQA